MNNLYTKFKVAISDWEDYSDEPVVYWAAIKEIKKFLSRSYKILRANNVDIEEEWLERARSLGAQFIYNRANVED